MELTPTLDLRSVDVPVGGSVRAEGPLELEPLSLAGQTYGYTPPAPALRLDVVRTLGAGWHLRLRGDAQVDGPCWVCLGDAHVPVTIDATEVHDASGEDRDMASSYVEDGTLDVAGWARDAVAEALPPRILCREDCAGICPRCGHDLNTGPCECGPPEPDPRWGPLAELSERLKASEGDAEASH